LTLQLRIRYVVYYTTLFRFVNRGSKIFFTFPYDA